MEQPQPTKSWGEDDSFADQSTTVATGDDIVDARTPTTPSRLSHTPIKSQAKIWKRLRTYTSNVMPDDYNVDHRRSKTNPQIKRSSWPPNRLTSNDSTLDYARPSVQKPRFEVSPRKAQVETSIKIGADVWERGSKFTPFHREREIVWLPEWQKDSEPLKCVRHPGCNLVGDGFGHPALILCQQSDRKKNGNTKEVYILAQLRTFGKMGLEDYFEKKEHVSHLQKTVPIRQYDNKLGRDVMQLDLECGKLPIQSYVQLKCLFKVPIEFEFEKKRWLRPVTRVTRKSVDDVLRLLKPVWVPGADV